MASKRTKQAADVPKATVEGLLDASIDTLALGIAAIRNEIVLISGDRGSESKHDKGSRIAYLTARVGAIADSIRKVEAARAKRTSDLTAAVVLAWFRQLDQTDRLAFIREASHIDERKSGLA